MSYVLTGLGSKLVLEPVLSEGGERASEAAEVHFYGPSDSGERTTERNGGSDAQVEVTGALLAVGIGLTAVWLIRRGKAK